MNLYILPSYCLHCFIDFFLLNHDHFMFLACGRMKELCFICTWYYTKYCNSFFVKFSFKNSWMFAYVDDIYE